MVEVVYTLLGIVFGFALDEIATFLRDKRAQERQVRSVRAIVSLEIDNNLDLAKYFWSKFSQYEAESDDLSQTKRSLARIFVNQALPTWQRDAFISQMQFLPIALSEAEILQVFHFYDRLNRLEAIRTNLTDALSEQNNAFENETSPGPAGFRTAPLGYRPPQMFNEKADELWSECTSLFAQILAKGNSLRKKSMGSHTS